MNIDNLLGQMTLAEKVGQLFLLAFSGSRLDEARVLIVEQMVGAAYISNDNVPTSQAALHLTQQLQAFARQTRLKIPLILGVDQEGAWAVMVPDSSPGPGNMALGATSDPRFAHDMYRVIGTELTAVGLNTVFAPCADCNSNPHNAIIGMRSFGQPPALVADMVAAAVQGAHEGGVITSVKHFPGHGDTTIDSHRGLPLVNRDRDTLYALDLLPFRRGIEAGTDMVMTPIFVFRRWMRIIGRRCPPLFCRMCCAVIWALRASFYQTA
jgi:Beta-glucosidase-related glycosidases